MTSRTSTAKCRVVSSNDIKEALGNALLKIKSDDNLTWEDMGAALGKSDDQAASYAAGHADMPVTAFFRGKAKFGRRFTHAADALYGMDDDAAPVGLKVAA